MSRWIFERNIFHPLPNPETEKIENTEFNYRNNVHEDYTIKDRRAN